MSSSNDNRLRFSKKAINRAGEILVADPQNEEALEILDYWRSLHAELIGEEGTFKGKVGVFSRRVKRSVSIIGKLGRFPKMQLTRMQDVAGLRYVLERVLLDSPTFQNVVGALTKALWENTSATRKSVDDYIEQPKPSGYRAIHHVYERHDSDNPLHDGLLVEFQFRTRPQHIWAMAVETVGMFYGQALKASSGDQGWLDFFKLASAAISHLENAPVVADHAHKTFESIRQELKQMGTEQSCFTKLAAIKEVDEKDSVEEYNFWLLELNIKKGTTAIYGFKADQLETAHEMYSAKERTPACIRRDTQVVLVSTESFKDLREAYPSYFLDVVDFTKTLREICRIDV